MIKIIEIIGKQSAILHSDGLNVYKHLLNEFSENENLTISFSDLKHCTTAFLHASIGNFLANISNAQEKISNNEITFYGIEANSILEKKLKNVQDRVFNNSKKKVEDITIKQMFLEA